MKDPARPLAGIRVLDFTQNLPGPYATLVLASLGAEVVKIEPPKGDPARHLGPLFEMLNRGKKSVMLDLRPDGPGRRALEGLVRGADVLVEGFRPGVMARLGCDAQTARAWNPGLVYCSISAYGQTGPRAPEPGHDLNAQALSGVCGLQLDDTGRPQGVGLPIADFSAAMTAVASICAALAAGGGATLDVAMTDAVVGWSQLWGQGIDLGAPVRARLRDGGALGRLVGPAVRRALLDALDRRKLYAVPHYGIFPARDARFLALGIVDEDHFWRSLCDVLGLGRLGRLPLPARTALGPLLRRVIARRLLARDREDWLRRFRSAGVPVTEVLTPGEARDEPQFVHRGVFDRDGWARPPLPQSVHVMGPAPALGAHNIAELGQS